MYLEVNGFSFFYIFEPFGHTIQQLVTMSTQRTIRNALKAIMTYEIVGVLTKICETKKDFGAKNEQICEENSCGKFCKIGLIKV